MLYDGESLPFLVEELIARAATGVALSPLTPAASHIPQLLPIIRKRVAIVDPQRRARREVLAVCRPIIDDLGFTVTAEGNPRSKADVAPAIKRAFGGLYSNIHFFLLGCHNGLQVDLDLAWMTESVRFLRERAELPQARAHLAQLEGILSTYQKVEVPSLKFVSNATTEQWAQFVDFADDAAYQDLSHDSLLLGGVEAFGRAIQLIGRKVRQMSSHPRFKAMVSLASTVVSVAGAKPAPSGDVADLIASSSFLPPILDLSPALARAEAAWRKAPRRPIDEDPFLRESHGSGWVEYDLPGQPDDLDVTVKRVHGTE